jgi:RHS repeat-associated protein
VTGLGQTVDYGYNEIGNMTSKQEGASHYTSMTYPAAGNPRPHAVTQANYAGGSRMFEYDANGNMTVERNNGNAVHQYGYNAEGMTSYRASTGETPFAVWYHYDANGTLFRKAPLGEGAGTVYIGGIYENNTYAGEVTKYYFAAGARIAMRKGGTLSFLTADHLGGTALVTDGSAAMVGRTRYYPYGQQRTSEGTLPTDKLYTGQQRETANGIYHYKARMYNADIGRMPQAGGVVPGGSEPAAYNEYNYVKNNPTNNSQPTGYLFQPIPLVQCKTNLTVSPTRRFLARSEGKWEVVLYWPKDFFELFVFGHLKHGVPNFPNAALSHVDVNSKSCTGRSLLRFREYSLCSTKNQINPVIFEHQEWYHMTVCVAGKAPRRQLDTQCGYSIWWIDWRGEMSPGLRWPF